MKPIILILGLAGAAAVVGVVLFRQPSSTTHPGEKIQKIQTAKTAVSEDFQRMGEKSFGVDVCVDMPKEEVERVLGKTVLKTKDYSNGMNTGCQYYLQDQHFVIVDVGYGDMENQRKGLISLDRKLVEEPRIGLPNFLSNSDKGLIDVYMNVAEGKKFVRVGRSSTTVVSEADLIELAIAVEKKIKSFK